MPYNIKPTAPKPDYPPKPQKPTPPSETPQIEQVPIAKLINYAKNARTHSPVQIDQIAASIKEFGFNAPILIDGENVIIAGHGRLMAAKKLELAVVPCVRLTHMSDTQKRAYILADNRLALNAGWDEEMLKLELAQIQIEGLDLGLLGFEAAEFKDMDFIEREGDQRSGASPWDRVGDASEGIMFSFGKIQARLSSDIAERFFQSAPQSDISTWLEGKLDEIINN